MKINKSILLFILTLLCSTGLFGQSQDSTLFVSHQWNEKMIKKGIVWRQVHISGLFDSEQEINIVEIDLKKQGKKLGLGAVAKGRVKTSVLAQQNNAIVAINGGFFNVSEGGAVDFIKVNGEVVNHTVKPAARANAYLAFDKKSVQISPDSSAVGHLPNIMLSGPFLLQDGTLSNLGKNAFNDNRHPRTAIAIKGNKLIMLTVDGRNAQAQGMNLHELAHILYWYGCEQAMNLDGGGSTTMYIKGQGDHGIVNYPSDNKLFDHQGERTVSNIVYVRD